MRRRRVINIIRCPRIGEKRNLNETTRILEACQLCKYHKGMDGDYVLCDFPKKKRVIDYKKGW